MLGQESQAAKHLLEEQRQRNHALHEESRHKMLQTDVKLKRAEEANQQLAAELRELKERYEALEPGSPAKKRRQTIDLLKDLDQILDDDRTFVGGHNLNMTAAGADLFGAETDPAQEYEFKIKLMEHDLQAVQSENNALVQTVLRLRQEYREKKNENDETAVRRITQEIGDLKREVAEADSQFDRLNEEIGQLKFKLDKMATASQRSIVLHDADNLKRAVDQLEQSNKVAIVELYDLKERNKLRQQEVEADRARRAGERQAAVERMEKDSVLVGELRMKILELTNEVKLLEGKKAKAEQQATLPSEGSGSKFSKEHLKTLRQTNERLMGEIIRLNGVIKEQKAADLSRMKQSLSISAIHFNEQSFDQTFASKFK